MSLFDATGKTQKEQYLDILALIYYVLAALGVLITLFVVAIMVFATTIPMIAAASDSGPSIGVMELVMGCIGFIVLAITLVSCGIQAWAGWCLQHRKGYVLVLIVSALMLLSVPLGTVLGVLTIMLLSEPEVKALFGAGQPASSAAPPAPASSPE